MSKPHKNQCGTQKLEPNEGRIGLLCNGPTLSKDTLSALEELGDILRGIHKRMISEGYEIVDGRIQKIRS